MRLLSRLKSLTNFRDRYVALKILVAGPPSRSINHHDLLKSHRHDAPKTAYDSNTKALMVNEICILQRLSDASSAGLHPGSAHILSLVDHFAVSGPNGTHHVLATEIAGPQLSDLVMPSAVVRELCRQLVEGVDYLHQQGITHRGKQYRFWRTLFSYLRLL